MDYYSRRVNLFTHSPCIFESLLLYLCKCNNAGNIKIKIMENYEFNKVTQILKEQGQGDYWRLNSKTNYCDSEIVCEDNPNYLRLLTGMTPGMELIGTVNSNWFDEGGQLVILLFGNKKATQRITMQADVTHSNKGIWGNWVTLGFQDMQNNPEDYVQICSGPY